MAASIIWQIGVDTWRDLVPEIGSSGRATVITRSGTARLLDHSAGRTSRLPLEGGHRLNADTRWQPLWELLVATPCGLVHSGDYGWSSTQVLVVFEGLEPAWLHHPIGATILDVVLAMKHRTLPGPEVSGHPDQVCGALYCAHRLRSAPAASR